MHVKEEKRKEEGGRGRKGNKGGGESWSVEASKSMCPKAQGAITALRDKEIKVL